jgi:hypothetical protein
MQNLHLEFHDIKGSHRRVRSAEFDSLILVTVAVCVHLLLLKPRYVLWFKKNLLLKT